MPKCEPTNWKVVFLLFFNLVVPRFVDSRSSFLDVLGSVVHCQFFWNKRVAYFESKVSALETYLYKVKGYISVTAGIRSRFVTTRNSTHCAFSTPHMSKRVDNFVRYGKNQIQVWFWNSRNKFWHKILCKFSTFFKE